MLRQLDHTGLQHDTCLRAGPQMEALSELLRKMAGPDMGSQYIVVTSAVIPLDYEQLVQKTFPAELQQQKEMMVNPRWSILS